jgi:hypothetical protein
MLRASASWLSVDILWMSISLSTRLHTSNRPIRPPNKKIQSPKPQVITVNPQWKFYGLNNSSLDSVTYQASCQAKGLVCIINRHISNMAKTNLVVALVGNVLDHPSSILDLKSKINCRLPWTDWIYVHFCQK